MAINLNYPKAKTFYEQNKMEVKEKTIDLSKYSFKFNRLTSNLYVDVFTHYKIKRDHSTCSSRFLLHDGFFKQDQYVNKNPSLRFGKIPGVYEICWIDSGFNAFNKMKSKYPKVYSEFLPITFITSDCVKLKNEMEKKELKNMSFILKRRRPSKISFVELKQLESNDNKTKIIIQQFISPYLIDGRKFDLRFYFIITNLKPLTVYQYKEGIAYFCKEQFNYTNSCFLYKKEVKKSDSDFQPIKAASEVMKNISNEYECLLKKIGRIGALVVLSFYKDIVDSVKKACEINDASFENVNCTKIRPLNRFFNLIAIDFAIDENGNPFIFDVCHNPGMKEINNFDKNFKFELIKDELELIIDIDENGSSNHSKWEKVLPNDDDESIKLIMNDISNEIFSRSQRIKNTIKTPTVTYI